MNKLRFPSSHSKRRIRLRVSGQARNDEPAPTMPLKDRERVAPPKGRRER